MSASQLAPAFLAHMSAESRDRLLQLATRRTLAAGERLLRQGGANDCLFIVESGALAVTRDSSDGSTGALLATLGPSEVAGDMSLLRGAPVSANVDASTTTGVLVIDASVVRSRPELFAELRAALGIVGMDRLDQRTIDIQRQHERELQAIDIQISATRFIVANFVALSFYMLSLPLSQRLAHIVPLSDSLVSLVFIVTFFFIAVNFLRGEGERRKAYGITLRHWPEQVRKGIYAALPIMALTLGAKIVGRYVTGGDYPLFDASRSMTGGDVVSILVVTGLSAAYFAFAFAQEIVRCSIQKALDIYYGAGLGDAPVRTILVTALCFAATHSHLGIAFAATAGVIGIYWGVVYRLTGSYIAVAVNHGVIGAFAVFIVGPLA
jgi:CRP-like cAMP-binding protein